VIIASNIQRTLFWFEIIINYPPDYSATYFLRRLERKKVTIHNQLISFNNSNPKKLFKAAHHLELAKSFYIMEG
jgi:hypothetical protein